MAFLISALKRRRRQFLVVIAVLVGGPRLAHAQQSCPAVSANARDRITDFLHNPAEEAWRRALALTDSTGDNLRALVDLTDAALCQRINAALSPLSPVYQVWSGQYVIATVDPERDPVTGKRIDGEWAVTLWVFDTTGTQVHAQGDGFLATPQDLHVTSSAGGGVALAWTNPSQGIVAYELQRAVGTGAFGSLGVTVSGATSSATDVTARVGTTYRYRLLARTSSPDSGYSNEVTLTATQPDVGTITRTTSGLLFTDDFNRPDEQLVGATKTWDRITIYGGTDADLNVVGNVATFTGNSDIMPRAKHTAQTGPVLVQTDWKRVSGGRTGIALHESTTGESQVFALRDPYHGWELWAHTNSGWLNVLNNGASLTDSTRLTLLRENGRIRFWAGSALIFDWYNGTMNGVSLRAGMYVIQPTNWDNFIACSGYTVTMAGLPSGYKLRVAGVVSAASTGTGTVALGLAGARLPVAQVEVLDGVGNVVKVFAPSDGVWGGDVYAYTVP